MLTKFSQYSEKVPTSVLFSFHAYKEPIWTKDSFLKLGHMSGETSLRLRVKPNRPSLQVLWKSALIYIYHEMSMTPLAEIYSVLLFSCVGVEDDRWRLVPVVARHFTRQITVRAGPARNIFVFTNWPTQHGLSRNKSQVFHWRLLLMLKYWFRTWCSDLSLKMWW